jgi:hypothetical protein
LIQGEEAQNFFTSQSLKELVTVSQLGKAAAFLCPSAAY